jgi:hypothetical protein
LGFGVLGDGIRQALIEFGFGAWSSSCPLCWAFRVEWSSITVSELKFGTFFWSCGWEFVFSETITQKKEFLLFWKSWDSSVVAGPRVSSQDDIHTILGDLKIAEFSSDSLQFRVHSATDKPSLGLFEFKKNKIDCITLVVKL